MTEKTSMNKDELFKAFERMFPEWAQRVFSYRKIGSRTIALEFGDGDPLNPLESLVFLYINDKNWQFGTKLWRKQPKGFLEAKKKKADLKNKNVQITKEETDENMISDLVKDLAHQMMS